MIYILNGNNKIFVRIKVRDILKDLDVYLLIL